MRGTINIRVVGKQKQAKTKTCAAVGLPLYSRGAKGWFKHIMAVLYAGKEDLLSQNGESL